jgi:hypothetical protein
MFDKSFGLALAQNGLVVLRPQIFAVSARDAATRCSNERV